MAAGQRQFQFFGGQLQGAVEASGIAQGKQLLGVGAAFAGAWHNQIKGEAAVVECGVAGAAAGGGGAGGLEGFHAGILVKF